MLLAPALLAGSLLHAAPPPASSQPADTVARLATHAQTSLPRVKRVPGALPWRAPWGPTDVRKLEHPPAASAPPSRRATPGSQRDPPEDRLS